MLQQSKQHSIADVDVTTATKGQQMPKPSQQRRAKPTPRSPQRQKMQPTSTPSQQEPKPGFLKVGTETDPERLAGAMHHQFLEGKTAFKVRVIGAGANNQLCKAVARLRERLRQRSTLPMMTPDFFVTKIGGEDRTGICWSIVFVPMKMSA